jgi:hypothetical protein
MLNPCEQCKRPVRSTETRCPFCDAAVEAPCETPVARRGLSRREMVALAAAAVAGSGCPKKPPPSPPYGCVWPDSNETVEV